MEIIDITGLNLVEEEIIEISLKKEDTYDIEVEDTHHYILDNGIISHNTSIFAGCVSSGIEPVFNKEYIRWMIVPEKDKTILRNKGMNFPNTFNGEWNETENFKFENRGDEEILVGSFEGKKYQIDKNRGLTVCTEIEDYGWNIAKDIYKDKLEEMKDIFVTANELSVNEHINILKIIAGYTDMNNSKTVNLPNTYSYNDFKKLYLEAYTNGIKGITTYRDKTMAAVLENKVIDYKNELEKQFVECKDVIIKDVLKLPSEYYSKGFKIKDRNKKKYYINIAFADSKYQHPFAVFVHTNNNEPTEIAEDFIKTFEQLLIRNGINEKLVNEQICKYEHQRNVVKMARIIGMALRHNIKMKTIVEAMDKFDIEMSSFVFHLKKILSKYIDSGTKSDSKCPVCNKSLIWNDGCKSCLNCGWSACN